MTQAIVWQPVFSLPPIFGSAAILAALTVFAWWRSRAASPRWTTVLAVMRLLAIAGIAVLMLGPSREIESRLINSEARLCLLVDTSESMRVADCDGESRIAAAAKAALDPKSLAALQRDYRLDLQGFDAAVRPLALESLRQAPEELAGGRETRLADSVTSALNRLEVGRDAVLILSDGRDTADDSVMPAATLARSKDIPIFSVAMGGSSTTTDAAVMAIPLQDSLLPNEAGGLLVRVYQSGLDGQGGLVRIRRGMAEQRFPIKFGTQRMVEIQAPIREEQPGQYEYSVSFESEGEETELANNSQQVFIEVMSRRLRVLMLEGQPFWDTKFLAQSLRKDEQLEIIQLTQVGDRKRETLVTRESQATPRLPRTAEEWSEFDVVILGRSVEHLLSPSDAAQLTAWVASGGHLVLARGRPTETSTEQGERVAIALGPVDPVGWGAVERRRFTLALTPSGKASAWFAPSKSQLNLDDAFTRLPGFEVLAAESTLKPATLVLATASDPEAVEERQMPAIVKMPMGRGDVVALLGEGSWKWSLLTPELQDLRGFYDLFWSNLVRWLALGGDFPPGQQTSLQLSRSSVRLGDELTADILYRIAPDGFPEPRMQVIGPDQQPIDVALHRMPGASPRFRGTWKPTSGGVHRVVAQTPGMTPAELSSRFNVYDVDVEGLQTSANPLTLEILSDISGGAVLTPGEIGKLSEHLQRHRQSLQAPPRIEYIWDQASIMVLLLGWLGIEWILRRVAGLW